MQNRVSPSPKVMNSWLLTRLRLQSAREGGGKHQLTLTESVNNSTTRQSEVTAAARRQTKNTEEETS